MYPLIGHLARFVVLRIPEKQIFITPIYCLPRIWTSGFPPGSIRRLSHFQEILVLGIFSWTYTRICFLALCFMNFWNPAIPRFEIRWIWGKCLDCKWQKGCIRSDFSQVKSSFWPRKTWVCNCADFESYSHKLTSPSLKAWWLWDLLRSTKFKWIYRSEENSTNGTRLKFDWHQLIFTITDHQWCYFRIFLWTTP